MMSVRYRAYSFGDMLVLPSENSSSYGSIRLRVFLSPALRISSKRESPMLQKTQNILGIDPGYARLGWAVLELREEGRKVWKGGGEEKLIACGCIETDKNESHERRLAKVADETRKLFEKYRPSKLAIEKLLFTKNQTTGIAVAESRGVVLAVAGALRCEVKEVGPMQVKLAVAGYGHADKKQVQEMVRRLLKLKKTPQPDDAADACAIALSCIH